MVGMNTSPAPAKQDEQGYRSIFAIFEGGGARGITHLGALKAIETENLALVGVAGTSAGAIIAALAAVGYKADELFPTDGSDDILKARGLSPLDLLGRRDWQRFHLLRPALIHAGVLLLAAGLALCGLVLLQMLHAPIGAAHGVLAGIILLMVGLLAIGSGRDLAWGIRCAIDRKGLFSTLAMRDTLNSLIREKLEQHYAAIGLRVAVPSLVRFVDIDPAVIDGCVPLKIIVTNVRTGGIEIFDYKNWPYVVIADAVAASAAIPLVFSPPRIRGYADDAAVFVDGGLVSNLPAWSFRNEKRTIERAEGGPPIPILAFTLADAAAAGDDRPASGIRALFRHLADVTRTGIFGSQAIVEQFVTDLEVIELISPLSTMGFDCSRTQAIAAYDAGLRDAELYLRKRRTIAALTNQALETVLGELRQAIAQRRRWRVNKQPHLRVSLIDPVATNSVTATPPGFRVVAHANMDADTDDRLEFDLNNKIAPRAFTSRKPVYGQIRGDKARDLMMTKYEHALIRRDRCSVISLPIHAGTAGPGSLPERIFCLDSSDSLRAEFEDQQFMALLKTITVITSRTLIEDLVK
jgi:NTE family protein